MDPEVLDQVRKGAEAEGISVSDFIREGIALRLQQAGIPQSGSRADLLAEIADLALKLRAGYVLVPSAEALPPGPSNTWASLLNGGEPS